MPLLTLKNISHHFGDDLIFDQLNFSINPNQKIGLIGRNGEGKSTLFKLINSQLDPDQGEIIQKDLLKVSALPQSVPTDLIGSILEIVTLGLGSIGKLLSEFENISDQLTHSPNNSKLLNQLNQYQLQIEAQNGWAISQRVQSTLSQFGLNPEAQFENLSGGMKRRVLLAQTLVSEPDILLLDEPTNHLDIEAIEWLEQFLINYSGTFLLITHDRAFLDKVSKTIIELDRGKLTQFEGRYFEFLKHKAHLLEVEAEQNKQFDAKLAQEEKWIRQGIKARRTRNEGRVRALKKLRIERSERRQITGKAKMQASEAEQSGRKVFRARNISYKYDHKILFENFNLDVNRGDKIGIVGPNGCGKSTLIKILLNQITPTTGSIKHGTQIEIAYFDQLRMGLDFNKTIQDNIGGGREFIEINGKEKHVLTYLRDFLFSPARARTTLKKLSGGELNRVLLAQVFSKPSNVLVLDEPTNDLDIETLELLEALIVDYPGTVLLISHDRQFLDETVGSCLVFEKNINQNNNNNKLYTLTEYIGGYSDWKNLKNQKENNNINQKNQTKQNLSKSKSKPSLDSEKPKKLSYKDQRLLEQLPKKIEDLEHQINLIQNSMAESSFFKKNPDEIKSIQNNLNTLEAELEGCYAEWERVENL